MTWWKRERNEGDVESYVEESHVFWEYVDEASEKVAGWSSYMKEGWSLVREEGTKDNNSGYSDPQDKD